MLTSSCGKRLREKKAQDLADAKMLGMGFAKPKKLTFKQKLAAKARAEEEKQSQKRDVYTDERDEEVSGQIRAPGPPSANLRPRSRLALRLAWASMHKQRKRAVLSFSREGILVVEGDIVITPTWNE